MKTFHYQLVTSSMPINSSFQLNSSDAQFTLIICLNVIQEGNLMEPNYMPQHIHFCNNNVLKCHFDIFAIGKEKAVKSNKNTFPSSVLLMYYFQSWYIQ